MQKGLLSQLFMFGALSGMLGNSGVGVGNVSSSGLYGGGYTTKSELLLHQIKRRKKAKAARIAKRKNRGK